MTNRRRLLLIVAAFAVIAAVPVVAWMVMPPQTGVTRANFDRIQEGMKQAEVELMLGGKGQFLTILMEEEEVAKKRPPIYAWLAEDGAAIVIGIDDGVVIHKLWQDSTETLVERIRRWLHL